MSNRGVLFLVVIVSLSIFMCFKPKPSNQIPIDFFPNPWEPSTTITIQGRPFKCLVDLGCGPALVLREIPSQLMQKEEAQTSSFADIRGNVYPTTIFRLHDAAIGSVILQNLEVFQDDNAFHFNAQYGSESHNLKQERAQARIGRLDGKIGRQALQNYDWLVDFPNSTLTLLSQGSGPQHCPASQFVALPFILTPLGICIVAQIDSGIHHFLLDTGSHFSFINQAISPRKELSEFSSHQLILGDYNYGPWTLDVFNISSPWSIEGCLGTDFFLEHVVYLDFAHNLVYIQKPERLPLISHWKRMKHYIIQFYRKNIRTLYGT